MQLSWEKPFAYKGGAYKKYHTLWKTKQTNAKQKIENPLLFYWQKKWNKLYFWSNCSIITETSSVTYYMIQHSAN